MADHKVVSRSEWLVARKELLSKEKEFTRLRDELSRERRELPWVKVDREYTFDAEGGQETLGDLFGRCSQLVVYHFMFGPDWEEGCPSCSFWADNFNNIPIHLQHRDVAFAAISRGPLKKLIDYKKRMGWGFKWVSSLESEFNQDYHVSFPSDKEEQGDVYYNYHMTKFPMKEAPGVSVFLKDNDGNIFHTYSCYSRGLDMLNSAYHHIDLTPKGRDEDDLPFSMAWVRRHDRYED
ncbi:MAG: thioredoxin [Moraxellaceae bacterium]|nr:MAG: thioredoxin [Moraxellaceae bacterium]